MFDDVGPGWPGNLLAGPHAGFDVPSNGGFVELDYLCERQTCATKTSYRKVPIAAESVSFGQPARRQAVALGRRSRCS